MNNRLLVLALAVASASVASAATIPAPSALSGLNPGDAYRFVFVTSTTTGNSNSLASYNSFVQGLANAAGIGSSLGVTWTAVLSTGSGASNALGNSPVSAATRVFLLNGTMVANGTTNPFYTEATPHLAAINYTEANTTLSGNNFVWSGGNASGSESGSGLVGGGNPIVGNAAGTDGCRCQTPAPGGWARYDNFNNVSGISSSLRVYAVSSAFTAPAAAVPEPATYGLIAAGLAGLALTRRRFKP